MDKTGLAAFLRSRRERVTPGDVGLPAGRRRRTPGLRREEVAQLAYISTEYYTRLEQARGPHPSRLVLGGISRALRLSDSESAQLHHLAGEPPAPASGPSATVRPSILDLLNRLPDAAAIVLDATYEVIAWNSLAVALLEDFSALPRRDRNLVRRYFLPSPGTVRRLYGFELSGSDDFGEFTVGQLRGAAARYPDDPGVQALVRELTHGSEEFTRLWALHSVPTARHLRKTMRHPVVGPLDLNCDILVVPDQDQHVVIHTADPGSPSEQALRLLAVVGTQRMDVR